MKFKEFIGIDVSKSHIDVAVYGCQAHKRFGNKESEFKNMIQWQWQSIDCNREEALFLFEHTGLYSLRF